MPSHEFVPAFCDGSQLKWLTENGRSPRAQEARESQAVHVAKFWGNYDLQTFPNDFFVRPSENGGKTVVDIADNSLVIRNYHWQTPFRSDLVDCSHKSRGVNYSGLQVVYATLARRTTFTSEVMPYSLVVPLAVFRYFSI